MKVGKPKRVILIVGWVFLFTCIGLGFSHVRNSGYGLNSSYVQDSGYLRKADLVFLHGVTDVSVKRTSLSSPTQRENTSGSGTLPPVPNRRGNTGSSLHKFDIKDQKSTGHLEGTVGNKTDAKLGDAVDRKIDALLKGVLAQEADQLEQAVDQKLVTQVGDAAGDNTSPHLEHAVDRKISGHLENTVTVEQKIESSYGHTVDQAKAVTPETGIDQKPATQTGGITKHFTEEKRDTPIKYSVYPNPAVPEVDLSVDQTTAAHLAQFSILCNQGNADGYKRSGDLPSNSASVQPCPCLPLHLSK